MGHRQPLPRVHLVFPSDPMAVRRALKSSMTGLRHLDMSQDERGTVELVLAEVLNNIVEHAYGGLRHGIIEMAIEQADDLLKIRVQDDGVAMPGEEVPPGRLWDQDCADEDLPEGGFGWFLIRELTHDLTYRRDGNRNRLSFKMALGDNCRPH